MLDVGMMIIIGAVFGAIGGLGHQLIDSEEKNTPYAIARAMAIGMITGIVVSLNASPDISLRDLILLVLGFGLSGDFVVLNTIRRRRRKR